MSLLTTADMTWFAMLGEQALTDDCQIKRKSSGCNVYSNVGSTVKCAVVNALYPQEIYEEGYVVRSVAKDILLPKGTETLSNDRLIVNSVKYRVIKTYSPETYEPLTRVATVTLQE